ncbi:hypothetical protein N7537_005812 [Penicillium hordei]|uniref:Uncharacterized protein n=1 Tax=Penicillium hordei TaxID=40994 RepID=A0AAD6E6I8_9EURO|nr:uncharacterized protein N7537_005812 [Penicillium hordei]KAJ5602856.1 hypothetical protein N7537_005812 [Penicillium hordei]
MSPANFAAILNPPGFRRLDIAMLADGQVYLEIDRCRRPFLNGRLRRALDEA